MDSSIPSYSKRSTCSQECTNVCTISLSSFGCIYTFTPKCYPTTVTCRLWGYWHFGRTFYLEIVVQFRIATSAVTCSTGSVEWKNCLSCSFCQELSHLWIKLVCSHLVQNTLEISFVPRPSQSWDRDSQTRWSGYLFLHGLGPELVNCIRVPAARR